MIRIYFDGSCLGNPGPGGRGVLILQNKEETELKGSEAHTTNNRMELFSAIESLRYAHENFPKEKITMVGDSNYVRLGITEYIHKRLANGRKLSNKSPVLNQDLRKQLHSLSTKLDIDRQRVKGHHTDKYNNIVDKLARSEAEFMKASNPESQPKEEKKSQPQTKGWKTISLFG